MARLVLLDEFHLSFLIPRGLPANDIRNMRRIIQGASFQKSLHDALRAVLVARNPLKTIRLRINR